MYGVKKKRHGPARFQHHATKLEPAKQFRVRAPMTETAEGTYFANRELCERAMSRDAPDLRAAAAHAEMADRYEALATVFGAKRLTKLPTDYR